MKIAVVLLGVARPARWFWIDPETDLTFVGMIQHPHRPTVREVRGLSRNLVYQAVVGP